MSAADVFTARFALSLQLPNGFMPEWVSAAAIGVAIVSVLAASALFTFLLERRLRYNLLVSMLPARVVRHMGSLSGAACAEPGAGAGAAAAAVNASAKTGGKVSAVGGGAGGIVSAGAGASAAASAAPTGAAGSFAERFEHVTVLFTDIVRFTDLVATITPTETMAMLNQLFFDFDDVVARAGVTKVETSEWSGAKKSMAPHLNCSCAATHALLSLSPNFAKLATPSWPWTALTRRCAGPFRRLCRWPPSRLT